ncbi:MULTISPECIES: 50S ribosomal protein L25/general stress protein Ctc [Niveibacterium]|uniref:Large ribosomal subunit protein bL25 n=1 Tax=Niveibacterium microcysteis TaxID=2811415 RepID=A0ABX7M7B5_9RHOO|nr:MULTISPECIES: 50S ribosomal protein L25/general stress protein Ctc [Niveibacterium]QSI77647.1 50S ribosomal protein L25/general stress protein Ctc [Niveibacterium microcysteis]
MQFVIKAEKRVEQGTGASRRLRRAGKAIGIIYGGDKAPVQITMDHNDLFHAMRKEAFHASVLTIEVEGAKETAVVRDTQWHAYKQQILHVDFQRVDATHKMHTKVPLHFVNADIAPGVKLEGGIVSHVMNEVDVECLPGNLPAFIEVDLKDLASGASIHVSGLKLPEGVKAVTHGDPVVATIMKTKGGSEAAEGEAQA